MQGRYSLIMDYLSFKAHRIVNLEEPPRGHAPKGTFYSADRISNEFFETTAEEAREKRIIESMPFLHDLIQQKIELANKARIKRREERDQGLMDNLAKDYDGMDKNQADERAFPRNAPEEMEGVSHCENISSSSMETHRLKHVSL